MQQDNSKQLTILWINDKRNFDKQAETLKPIEIYYDLGLKGQVSIHNQL